MELWKNRGMKGLFSKQKEDPEFLDRQLKTRQALLKNLSRAVKEAQLLYTRSDNEVLNDSRPVQRLCSRFEDVLRHGLKVGWLGGGKQPSFWPIVLNVSRKQAINYINSLQHAQTDNGRCRAWIRLATNESSLESYINIICQDSHLLNYYYETYAFLRDDEVVSTMRQLLAGLSQISFNITIDTASLEFAPAPEALEPALRLRAPQPIERGGKTKDTTVPSSTSTPLVSSSGSSSWMTSSAESSSVTINSSHVVTQVNAKRDQLESNHVNEIIRDDLAGLEASVHVEDDALIVDSVVDLKRPSSLAYSDLDRFKKALEEEEKAELEEKAEPVDVGKGEWLHMEGAETGSISDNVEDSPIMGHLECDETQQPSPSPHHSSFVSSAKETTPTDTPTDAPVRLSSSTIIQEIVEEVLVAVEEEKLESSNVELDEKEERKEREEREIEEEREESEIEEEKKAVEEEEEEHSFGYILRLASGLPTDDQENGNDTEEKESEQNEDIIEPPEEQRISSSPYHSREDAEQDQLVSSGVVTDEGVESRNDKMEDEFVPHLTNPFSQHFVDLTTPTQVTFSTNPFLVDDDEEEHHALTTPTNPSMTTPTGNPFSNTDGDFETHLVASVQSNTAQDYIIVPESASSPSRDSASSDILSAEELMGFDISEDYYGTELSLSEVDYRVIQLKNYLRRDSSDLKLGQMLVKLQLLKQEMAEAMENSQFGMNGHHFEKVPKSFRSGKCETCNRAILIRQTLKCLSCGYVTHEKCLPQITGKCLAETVKEKSEYLMSICPEKSLTLQHFRCSCCNQALNASNEVRLCDYTGLYHCTDCHHNDLSIIPARVLKNWDFSARRVCCNCSKMLSALSSRPLVAIQLINPLLYTYVHEIGSIENLRNDILLMKNLIVKCDRAKEDKLMQELNLWPHFKESSNLFSINDLMEIHNGTLLAQLQAVHEIFLSHICKECEKCSLQGEPCIICNSRDLLFAFSKDSTYCPNCLTKYHKECFHLGRSCPVCIDRRKSRLITTLK